MDIVLEQQFVADQNIGTGFALVHMFAVDHHRHLASCAMLVAMSTLVADISLVFV